MSDTPYTEAEKAALRAAMPPVPLPMPPAIRQSAIEDAGRLVDTVRKALEHERGGHGLEWSRGRVEQALEAAMYALISAANFHQGLVPSPVPMDVQRAMDAVAAIPQKPEADPGDYYTNKRTKAEAVAALLRQPLTPEAKAYLDRVYEMARFVGD